MGGSSSSLPLEPVQKPSCSLSLRPSSLSRSFSQEFSSLYIYNTLSHTRATTKYDDDEEEDGYVEESKKNCMVSGFWLTFLVARLSIFLAAAVGPIDYSFILNISTRFVSLLVALFNTPAARKYILSESTYSFRVLISQIGA